MNYFKIISYVGLGCITFSSILSLQAYAHSAEVSWQRERAAEVKQDKNASFAMNEIAAKVGLYQHRAAAESFAVGLQYKRTSFDWNAQGLDENYVWFGVPLNYQQQRSKNVELIARIEPGVMSTGHSIDKKNIYANAELSGRVHVHKSMFWQLGAVVDRSFGDARVYPLAAFAWKPDAITEVQLGFPYSQVHARWNNSFSTYAKVQPNGGMWRLKDITQAAAPNPDPDVPPEEPPVDPEPPVDGEEENGNSTTVASDSKKLRYQSWQFAFGSNLHWRDGLWLNAEAGYHFERKLEQTGLHIRPKDALYWKIGLKVEF